MRSEFEAWATRSEKMLHVFSLTRHPNEDRYLELATELCYQSWLAAKATVSQEEPQTRKDESDTTLNNADLSKLFQILKEKDKYFPMIDRQHSSATMFNMFCYAWNKAVEFDVSTRVKPEERYKPIAFAKEGFKDNIHGITRHQQHLTDIPIYKDCAVPMQRFLWEREWFENKAEQEKPDEGIKFQNYEAFTAAVKAVRDEREKLFKVKVVGTFPEDFITHQHSWRKAIYDAAELATVRGRHADYTYWKHELKAFDDAYLELWKNKG